MTKKPSTSESSSHTQEAYVDRRLVEALINQAGLVYADFKNQDHGVSERTVRRICAHNDLDRRHGIASIRAIAARLNREKVTLHLSRDLQWYDLITRKERRKRELDHLPLPWGPVAEPLAVTDFITAVSTPDQTGLEFAGRQDVLHKLNQWLAKTTHPSYLLLEGAAGAGKTSLLVHWYESLLNGQGVTPVFVPITVRFQTAGELVFYQNLVDSLKNAMNVYSSLDPLGNREDAHRQAHELLEMICRREENRRRVLIIVDGLDEARDWIPDRAISPLEPYDNLSILASARPRLQTDTDWMQVLGWRHLPFAHRWELAGLTTCDIVEIVTKAALGESGHGVNEIAGKLQEATGGDALLVSMYLRDALQRDGTLYDVDYGRMPRGLDDVFKQWWEDQRAIWGADYVAERPIYETLLDALALAEGPIRLDDLAGMLYEEGATAARLGRALRDLSRFLSTGAGGDTYMFGHPRLGEYWRKELPRPQRRHVHRRFINYGRRAICETTNSVVPSPIPDYVVRHHTTHLWAASADANEWSDPLRPLWHSASEQTEPSGELYVRDLRRCRAAINHACRDEARSDKPIESLVHQVAAAIAFACIYRSDEPIPPALLASLVEEGVWSVAKASAHVDQGSLSVTDEIDARTQLLPFHDAKQKPLATRKLRSLLRQSGDTTAWERAIPHLVGVWKVRDCKAMLAMIQAPPSLDDMRLLRSINDHAATLADDVVHLICQHVATTVPESLQNIKAVFARLDTSTKRHILQAAANTLLQHPQDRRRDSLDTVLSLGKSNLARYLISRANQVDEETRCDILTHVAKRGWRSLESDIVDQTLTLTGKHRQCRPLVAATASGTLKGVDAIYDAMNAARLSRKGMLAILSGAIAHHEKKERKDLRDRAHQLAATADSPRERAEGLATLAHACSRVRADELAREALTECRRIEPPYDRCSILVEIAPVIAKSRRKEILDSILESLHGYEDIGATHAIECCKTMPAGIVDEYFAKLQAICLQAPTTVQKARNLWQLSHCISAARRQVVQRESWELMRAEPNIVGATELWREFIVAFPQEAIGSLRDKHPDFVDGFLIQEIIRSAPIAALEAYLPRLGNDVAPHSENSAHQEVIRRLPNGNVHDAIAVVRRLRSPRDRAVLLTTAATRLTGMQKRALLQEALQDAESIRVDRSIVNFIAACGLLTGGCGRMVRKLMPNGSRASVAADQSILCVFIQHILPDRRAAALRYAADAEFWEVASQMIAGDAGRMSDEQLTHTCDLVARMPNSPHRVRAVLAVMKTRVPAIQRQFRTLVDNAFESSEENDLLVWILEGSPPDIQRQVWHRVERECSRERAAQVADAAFDHLPPFVQDKTLDVLEVGCENSPENCSRYLRRLRQLGRRPSPPLKQHISEMLQTDIDPGTAVSLLREIDDNGRRAECADHLLDKHMRKGDDAFGGLGGLCRYISEEKLLTIEPLDRRLRYMARRMETAQDAQKRDLCLRILRQLDELDEERLAQRSLVMAYIVPFAPEECRHEVLAKVRTLLHPGHITEYAWLSDGHITDPQLVDALLAAIEQPRVRDIEQVISSIAESLSTDQIPRAIEIVFARTVNRDRARCLAALLPRMPDVERPKLVFHALSAISGDSGRDRCEVISDLMPEVMQWGRIERYSFWEHLTAHWSEATVGAVVDDVLCVLPLIQSLGGLAVVEGVQDCLDNWVGGWPQQETS